MIQTKVAKILDPTRVILAAGAVDGVKQGMEFIIYDVSETIRDPETGEDLGQLELVKGHVHAVQVQDRLTWAETKSRTVRAGPFSPLAAAIAAARTAGLYTTTETFRDQLQVAEPTPLPTTDLTVRVGDRVRSVYQPEFAPVEAAK